MVVSAPSVLNRPATTKRRDVISFLGISSVFVAAEGTVLFGYGEAGLVMHAIGTVTLFGLIQRSTEPRISLYQSMLLIPVLRIFNLGIPIFTENSFIVLGVMYSFLLLSTVVIIRSQELSFRELGLTLGKLPFGLVGIPVGVAFGGVQYLLALEGFSYARTPLNFVLLVLTAGVLVGLVEELIFRGLIQRWATALFDNWVAIVAISILFGFMHSVWLAPLDVVFAATVSLFIGWIYVRTNNMLFIASLHGMINVAAFLIFPLVAPEYEGVLGPILQEFISRHIFPSISRAAARLLHLVGGLV